MTTEKAKTAVQTLIMSQDKFSKSEAEIWARTHGFMANKVDAKENTYRLRQHNPNLFISSSFRTIDLAEGVKAVTGSFTAQGSTERTGLMGNDQNNTL